MFNNKKNYRPLFVENLNQFCSSWVCYECSCCVEDWKKVFYCLHALYVINRRIKYSSGWFKICSLLDIAAYLILIKNIPKEWSNVYDTVQNKTTNRWILSICKVCFNRIWTKVQILMDKPINKLWFWLFWLSF